MSVSYTTVCQFPTTVGQLYVSFPHNCMSVETTVCQLKNQNYAAWQHRMAVGGKNSHLFLLKVFLFRRMHLFQILGKLAYHVGYSCDEAKAMGTGAEETGYLDPIDVSCQALVLTMLAFMHLLGFVCLVPALELLTHQIFT